MKVIDQLFGWVLVALGVVWFAFTFRAHGFSSFSVYSPGVLIIIAGLVNVSRASTSNGLLRFTAAFATSYVLVMAAMNAFTLRAVLRQNPQAPILVIASVIEIIFCIWG